MPLQLLAPSAPDLCRWLSPKIARTAIWTPEPLRHRFAWSLMERWTENVAKHSHLHHHRAAVHNVAVWLWQSARWWPKRSILSGTRSQGKALECQHRLAVTSWAHCHYHLSPSKQHHDPKNSQGLWWNDGCEFAYGYNMSARMCVCMRYFAITWRSVFFFVASTVAMYANRLITSSPINNCDEGGQLCYLLWWKVTKTSELYGSTITIYYPCSPSMESS